MANTFERPLLSEISMRPPIIRCFSISFDGLISLDKEFMFYSGMRLLAKIEKDTFTHAQRTFFEAIADTNHGKLKP